MTERQSSVTVVVPVGGIDPSLDEQLDALRSQVGAPEFDVVLACNSSAPEDQQVLREIADREGTSWAMVDASDRRGPARARNVGASASSSDLLLFCDADDVVCVGWVRAMFDALATSHAVTGPLPPFGPPAALAAKPAGAQDRLPRYMGVPYLPSGNLGIHRRAFESVGGFDERLSTSEDIALSWSLQARGWSVDWAQDAVVRRRYRGGVPSMLRQHFRYGRGISRVLSWYGIPTGDGWRRPGLDLVRGNPDGGTGNAPGRRTVVGVARRGALAFGRLVGVVEVAAAALIARVRS